MSLMYKGSYVTLPAMNELGNVVSLTDGTFYVFDGAKWQPISDEEPHERQKIIPHPETCRHCGAPLHSNRCEYCGVEYTR